MGTVDDGYGGYTVGPNECEAQGLAELPLVGLPVYDATGENISVTGAQKDVGGSRMRTGEGGTTGGKLR